MKVTAVVAVHNEVEYLRYSLPALKQIPFDQYIFVLDRCTDDSFGYLLKHFHQPPKSFIILKDRQIWTKTRAGETFQYGFDRARNDLVFAVGADLILPPSILSIVESFMNAHTGAIFFGATQRSYRNLQERLHSEYLNFRKKIWLNPHQKHLETERQPSTGIYCFKKSIARLRDVPAEYIDLHNQIRMKGHKTIYIPDAGITHLRPPISKEKQYWSGVVQARLNRKFHSVLYASIADLKPHLFVGYMKTRNKPIGLPSMSTILRIFKSYIQYTLHPILPKKKRTNLEE